MCGRTLPLIERIEGRIPDLIFTPNGAVLVPHFFVVLFKDLQTVERYQVIQDTLEHIRILLVGRDTASRLDVEAAIRDSVTAATGSKLELEFEWVSAIPLSGEGKRRLVISEVSRLLLGGYRRSGPDTAAGLASCETAELEAHASFVQRSPV